MKKEVIINKGDDVLVTYPGFGSVWLSRCEVVDRFVVGQVWDTTSVGSYNMPDDFQGENTTMNFPLTCVRKVCPPINLTRNYYGRTTKPIRTRTTL